MRLDTSLHTLTMTGRKSSVHREGNGIPSAATGGKRMPSRAKAKDTIYRLIFPIITWRIYHRSQEGEYNPEIVFERISL